MIPGAYNCRPFPAGAPMTEGLSTIIDLILTEGVRFPSNGDEESAPDEQKHAEHDRRDDGLHHDQQQHDRQGHQKLHQQRESGEDDVGEDLADLLGDVAQQLRAVAVEVVQIRRLQVHREHPPRDGDLLVEVELEFVPVHPGKVGVLHREQDEESYPHAEQERPRLGLAEPRMDLGEERVRGDCVGRAEEVEKRDDEAHADRLEGDVAAQAQVHIAHVMEGFPQAPDGQGLLSVAKAEAEVAAQHAELAGGDRTNVDPMIRHARHVLHAVDPSRFPNGPGAGFGVKAAADAIAQHIEMAASAEGASEGVQRHAPHVAAASRAVSARVDEIADVVAQIVASSDYTQAYDLVGQLQEVLDVGGRVLAPTAPETARSPSRRVGSSTSRPIWA